MLISPASTASAAVSPTNCAVILRAATSSSASTPAVNLAVGSKSVPLAPAILTSWVNSTLILNLSSETWTDLIPGATTSLVLWANSKFKSLGVDFPSLTTLTFVASLISWLISK